MFTIRITGAGTPVQRQKFKGMVKYRYFNCEVHEFKKKTNEHGFSFPFYKTLHRMKWLR